MPLTARQIEWHLGLEPGSLNFETAKDLGIGEFVNEYRPLWYYKAYYKRKLARKEQLRRLKMRANAINSNWLLHLWYQAYWGRIATRVARRNSYVILRKMWAARRANCARRRAEKAMQEQRLKVVKMLQPFING